MKSGVLVPLALFDRIWPEYRPKNRKKCENNTKMRLTAGRYPENCIFGVRFYYGLGAQPDSLSGSKIVCGIQMGE